MDWEGQKLAEQLMQILLLAFAAAAFVTGYLIGSFQMMLLVYLGGGVLTALVIVPNWPLFNRHPLNWLQPSEADLHPKPIREAPTTKKKPLKHNAAIWDVGKTSHELVCPHPSLSEVQVMNSCLMDKGILQGRDDLKSSCEPEPQN